MLAQGNLDFHSRVGIIAQHFDDTPDRLRVLARLLDDFHHHHLPGLRLQLALLVRRHQDIVRQTAVLRHHDHHPVLDEHPTDHPRIGALGNLDDIALRASPSINADNARQHTVTVHDLAHLPLIEEQVGTAIIRQQETIAIWMPLHLAGDQTGFLRQDVIALAVTQDLALALHGTKPAQEDIPLVLADVERTDELFKAERPPLITQQLDDVLARRQGEFIAGEFALKEWISATNFR